jgi:hypothetical protein
MKTCNKCKTEKSLDCFVKDRTKKDGLSSKCKVCEKQRKQEYREKNITKLKEKEAEYRKNNREILRKRSSEYYVNNKETLKKTNSEYYRNNIEDRKNYQIIYRENNLDKIKKRKANWYKNKRQSDSFFRLKECVKNRINKCIIKNGKKTIDLIGCSYDFLREYLEKQFTQDMSWENYGIRGWHIDHKIPLASAKTEEEVIKLCHYTNLQPLWWDENLKKGSKVL